MSFRLYNTRLNTSLINTIAASQDTLKANILYVGENLQIFPPDKILLTAGELSHFEFHDNTYKYIGLEKDAVLISVNIKYQTLFSLPYEICEFIVTVNGIEKHTNKYGFDMQNNIHDTFIIMLNPDDIIAFMIKTLHQSNSTSILIKENSFITLRPLKTELNTEL